MIDLWSNGLIDSPECRTWCYCGYRPLSFLVVAERMRSQYELATCHNACSLDSEFVDDLMLLLLAFVVNF